MRCNAGHAARKRLAQPLDPPSIIRASPSPSTAAMAATTSTRAHHASPELCEIIKASKGAKRRAKARLAAQVEANRLVALGKARHAEARAHILDRFGYSNEAEAVRISAPTPPADARPPMERTLAAPTAYLPADIAKSHKITPATVAGSLVSTASPQRLIAQMLEDIPPGERRARQLAVRAACQLVQIVITILQAAKVLGITPSRARSMPREKLAADLVAVYGFGWAQGTIDGGRNEWLRIIEYAATVHGWKPPQRLDGHIVRQYLNAVGVAAHAKYRDRVARGVTKPRPGDTAGSTAKGRAVANLKWLTTRCHSPIDMASVAVQSVCKRARKYTAKAQQSFSLRMVAILSWHTEFGPNEFVRGVAGGIESLPMVAQRFVNAQRSTLLSVSGGVVRGANGFDGKIGSASQVGKPFWTSERDVRGSRSWLDSIITMLQGVEDQHFLIRATNSPDGNPFLATAWRDQPETRARATVALHALLSTGPYAIPREVAITATLHGGKRFLANCGRAASMSVAESIEVGAWAGSRAQNARVELSRDKSVDVVSSDMPDTYSAEAADEVVPEIMDRLVGYCRTLTHALGIPSLPPVGGWTLFTRFRPTAPGQQPAVPHSA